MCINAIFLVSTKTMGSSSGGGVEYQWIAFQKFVGCELVTVVSSPASILLNGAAWAGAETFIREMKRRKLLPGRLGFVPCAESAGY
jgi:hypothetical protein